VQDEETITAPTKLMKVWHSLSEDNLKLVTYILVGDLCNFKTILPCCLSCCNCRSSFVEKETNSMARVRKQIIPTWQLLLVGKVRDCLFGLVVRVPAYRSRGLGLIPSATRFSEKQFVWNGVHSALLR
jgi:hypothetical protein